MFITLKYYFICLDGWTCVSQWLSCIFLFVSCGKWTPFYYCVQAGVTLASSLCCRSNVGNVSVSSLCVKYDIRWTTVEQDENENIWYKITGVQYKTIIVFLCRTQSTLKSWSHQRFCAHYWSANQVLKQCWCLLHSLDVWDLEKVEQVTCMVNHHSAKPLRIFPMKVVIFFPSNTPVKEFYFCFQ